MKEEIKESLEDVVADTFPFIIAGINEFDELLKKNNVIFNFIDIFNFYRKVELKDALQLWELSWSHAQVSNDIVFKKIDESQVDYWNERKDRLLIMIYQLVMVISRR